MHTYIGINPQSEARIFLGILIDRNRQELDVSSQLKEAL
jgi:hypothetical protein